MIEKAIETEVNKAITFKEGMEVICQRRYGSEIMIVHRVYDIPSERERQMALHHQHVVLRHKNGAVDPDSLSGYYLTLPK